MAGSQSHPRSYPSIPLHLRPLWLVRNGRLTTTNGFTKRGIKIECASSASAIRGISFQLAVLVDVTACLPTDPASCNDNAAGEGGASDVLLAPGVTSQLRFARRVRNMISDPTVRFEASGSLPLLGSMTFTGELSKTSFLLAATRSMDFFGIVATDYRFEIGLSEGDFTLAFSSDDRWRQRDSNPAQAKMPGGTRGGPPIHTNTHIHRIRSRSHSRCPTGE
jgi:hypothetical protein